MDQEEKSHGKRWSPAYQIQDEEVLALLEKQNPGQIHFLEQGWAYSNSGYVVLGLIVAKASGVSYPEFLKRRIFDPLHMQNTLAYQRGSKEIPLRGLWPQP